MAATQSASPSFQARKLQEPGLVTADIIQPSMHPDPASPPTHTHCQNCGTELKGHYCHSCGQHDFEEHQSFWHLAHELLESFFHFEGRFFQGTFNLLFRPGALTKEFNAGRRASQMPPLRLYIFLSLLFFLAPGGGSGSRATDLQLDGDVKTTLAEEARSAVNTVKEQSRIKDSHVTIGSKQDNWDRIIREKLKHTDKIVEHFYDYLPKMMLACVPLFALLSYVTFRKAGMNYLQHLVFSLHLHSFFWLFRLVSVGWALTAGLFSDSAASAISWVCAIYMPIYAYRALRNVFGQHRKGTLLRGCLLLGSYGLVLILGFLVTAIIAVVMT